MSLQTDQSLREVWVIKVPKHIGDRWKTACMETVLGNKDKSGKDLGTISLQAGFEEAVPEGQLTLPGGEKYKLVDTLNTGGDPTPMGVLSCQQTKQEEGEPPKKRARVDGKICKTFSAQPVVLANQDRDEARERYKQLTKIAAEKAASKKEVKIIEKDELGLAARSHVMLMRAQQARQPKGQVAAAATTAKRHLEDDELQDYLFRLFERQAYWDFKHLVKETKQSGQRVKKALNEIAVKVPRGVHKDMYTLKKELRDKDNGTHDED